MKKFPIGFNTKVEEKKEEQVIRPEILEVEPRKSLVQVYFPLRGMGYAYYNDSFDLKVGDLVYVEGKLEGMRGRVTEVNYSFKIKLSDYKKVIALIDTDVTGEVYLADTHVITFDKNALSYEKVISWFKAPCDEEYVIGEDEDENCFPLDDIKQMGVSQVIAERGYEYYMDNKVAYISLDGFRGYAIVEGSENYLVEFEYVDGEIRNLTCDCFCAFKCKHEFAAMLQLKDILGYIEKEFPERTGDYFAAISKETFINTVMTKNKSGRIILE